MFEDLPGQTAVKEYLKRALTSESLPHALLFAGPIGVGKRSFGFRLAEHLLGAKRARIEGKNHPDFFVIEPEGKGALISIEKIRTIQDDVYTAPFEAGRKVFIFDEADRMQPAAANALLKTLEEPSPHSTLILLTSRPADLLPTIRSRCTRVSFQPEKESVSLLQKLLFSLLKEKLSTHLQMNAIQTLEDSLDEDPRQRAHQIDHLFALILMWFRDQHAQLLKEHTVKLFFPEEKRVLYPLPPMEKIEAAVRKMQQGIERNLKLSHLLYDALT